jgi:tellurite resistance protein TehA-like permease
MATGILSFGFAVDHRNVLSRILLAVTALSFVVLCVLTVWRFLAWRGDFVEDFTHPLRGFGFYSFVAAANVLAVRVAARLPGVAVALLVVSAAAWLVRGYAVPWTTHLDRGERPIVKSANGTWFMWAVAGQSIGLAASTLAAHHGGEVLPFVAVCGWALGLFLYAVDGVFVVMRLLSYEFSAADLTPPYWIAMGAAAISSLAGVHLATLGPDPFVDVVRELARGSGLALWVIATWLVPGLFAMGWWRHVSHRVPLRYDASMWSIIFPLGMYATTSRALADLEHLPGLELVGTVALWVAFVAWLLAAAGLVHHVGQDVLRPPGEAPA